LSFYLVDVLVDYLEVVTILFYLGLFNWKSQGIRFPSIPSQWTRMSWCISICYELRADRGPTASKAM